MTWTRIPTAFWRTFSKQDFKEMYDRGYLNAEQCRRLYRMTERQQQPPKRISLDDIFATKSKSKPTEK
jgi:hypothetical protein